jgi:NADH-quinone oxidoreductase subunit A
LSTIPGPTLWPLVVYFLLVVVLLGAMIGLSYLLGERHKDRATGEPYESGIVSTGSARQRLSAKFYLIAMFFVVFDIEAAFLFVWAVALRDVGWSAYAAVSVFVAVLVISLIYLWRQGALDWATKPSRKLSQPRRLGADRLQPARQPLGAASVTTAQEPPEKTAQQPEGY